MARDRQGYSIRLYREDLNFSAAHVSTYGNDMEGQHGHNYQLSVEFEGPLDDDSVVVDFRTVKKILRGIIDRLNHRTLVPRLHPKLQVESDKKSTRIRFRDERLELPTRDVVFLEVPNLTSEMLARSIFDSICEQLPRADRRRLHALSVEIVESPGQSARYVGSLA